MIGVDGSPQMLAIAKAKMPGADFRLGDLRALPVADHAVDLVTIALALSHVPDLAPVLAAPPAERVLPDHPSDFWTLRAWYPAAAYAAYSGTPMLIFWDFQLC